MIRTEQLTKKYKTLSGDVIATDHVNLHFSCNGLYMILGKSGCGKTTLLNVLSGLDAHDEGHLYVDGVDVSSYDETQLDHYRNLKMGVIFQEYNLISEFTVWDNLRLVLEIQDWEGKSEAAICTLIEETLEKVGLKGYASRHINQLSGGEQQRVAIARTLIKQPNIIFADEPTGNLDSKNSKIIFELLSEIAKEYVVIVVTHDRDSALQYGDTIIEMENSQISKIEQRKQTNQNTSYTLHYQKNKEQQQTLTVPHTQLGQFLAELVAQAKETDIIQLSNIEKQFTDSPSPSESSVAKTAVNKKAQKLPWIYRFRLTMSFLTKKKLTLFLTVCMLTISLALFFGALTTTFYQRDKTTLAYMNTYHPSVLPVYATKTYVDTFYQTQMETLSRGEYLSGVLENSVPSGAIKLNAIYDKDFATVVIDEMDRQFTAGVTMLFIPETYTNFSLVEGSTPQQNNQCMITDYLASELGVGTGDRITNYEQELIISGIIQTDYIAYQLKAKLNYGSDSPYVDYYYRNRYNVVYCKIDLLHNNMPKSNARIRLAMSDFTAAHKERTYRESEIYYDNANKIKASDLVAGRLPQTKNEILVSEEFWCARNPNHDISEFTSFSGEFVDLDQESFGHCYSMHLNLFSFFSEGVNVVGVVSPSEFSDYDADVFVPSEVWDEISELYYQQYAADILYTINPKDYSPFVTALSHHSILIDEPALSQIYAFADALQNMKMLLYALLIITVLLSGFMLTNFIQISIRSNKRNIGILRALGIPMQEVSRLFTIESWIVYISSVLCSVPLILVMQRIANQIYTQNIVENLHNIITWNWQAALIVVLVSVAVSVLALQIPLWKLKQLKPIELIRSGVL